MLKRLHVQATEGKVAVAVQSRYRIMVWRANGETALYRVLPTMAQAKRIAEVVCQHHQERIECERAVVVADPARPRRVYIETWCGSATNGQWKLVPFSDGGFQRRFSYAAPARGKRQRSDRWSTGQQVECILLAEKTRRGGWRATIAGTQHAGPVTGIVDDSESSAGDTVSLKLCSLSRRTGDAQFSWPS